MARMAVSKTAHWGSSPYSPATYSKRSKIMGKIFRLKEDLPLDEDHFGVRKSAGVAKVGTLYELVA